MEHSNLKYNEGLMTPSHISLYNLSVAEPAPGLFTRTHSYLCSLLKGYMLVFILLCFHSSSVLVTYCFINKFNNRCINLIYIMLRWTLVYLGTSMSKFLKMFDLMLQGVFNQGVNSQASFRLEERPPNRPFTFPHY